LKKYNWESVDWIHLAKGRDWWRASVDTAMNPGVLKNMRELSDQLSNCCLLERD
jgi:hypothetical protein